MAIGLAHEEYRNHVAKGLREIVIQLDSVVGNSSWRSTAADAASLQNLMRQQALPSNIAIHEVDKTRFQIAIRKVDEMVRLGILDAADIQSMNDLPTSRVVFESEDATLTGMK